jgi:hypothetical protein
MESTVRTDGPCGGAYRAWPPVLAGCQVYGRSRREAEAAVQQAVRGCLEHLSVALPMELERHTRLAPAQGVRGQGAAPSPGSD